MRWRALLISLKRLDKAFLEKKGVELYTLHRDIIQDLSFLFPGGSLKEEPLSFGEYFPFQKFETINTEISDLYFWKAIVASYPQVTDEVGQVPLENYHACLNELLIEKGESAEPLISLDEARKNFAAGDVREGHYQKFWHGFRMALKESTRKDFDNLLDIWFFQRNLNSLKNDFVCETPSPMIDKILSFLGTTREETSLNVFIGSLIFKPFKKDFEASFEKLESLQNMDDCELLPHFERYKENLVTLEKVFDLKKIERNIGHYNVQNPYSFSYAIECGKNALRESLNTGEHHEIHNWGLFNVPYACAPFFNEAIILKNLKGVFDDNYLNDTLIPNLIDGWHKANFFYFKEDVPMPRDLDTTGSFLNLWQFTNDSEVLAKIKTYLDPHLENEETFSSIWVDNKNPKYIQNMRQHYCDIIFLNFVAGYIHNRELFRECYDELVLNYLSSLGDFDELINISYRPLYEILPLSEIYQSSSGFLQGETRKTMKERIVKMVEIFWKDHLKCGSLTPTENAWITIALEQVGELSSIEQKRLKAEVRQGQLPDGLWRADPFYYTPSFEGRITYFQSRNISTAFSLKALSLLKDQ